MLEVGREQEGQDHVEGHLVSDEREFRWLLWDREQENVSLLVCIFGVIRPVEGIFDVVLPIDSSERLWILQFSFLWASVANELLPPDDWTFKLDVFFPVVFCRKCIDLVYEQ